MSSLFPEFTRLSRFGGAALAVFGVAPAPRSERTTTSSQTSNFAPKRAAIRT